MDTTESDTPYHEGERTVQERAGVRAAAKQVASMIRTGLSKNMRAFLTRQPFVVAATVDRDNRVWGSLLTGDPGFASAPASDRVRIDTLPNSEIPFADHGRVGMDVGLLFIDPRDRSRLRVNGTATTFADDGFELVTEEVYPNCQKYIQRRSLSRVSDMSDDPEVRRHDGLNETQRQLIRSADTFFIATDHPEHGADASHRGGDPGFIGVRGDTLVVPDYPGNNMFCTLGNIEVTDRAGLLFVDFKDGDILQLSCDANLIWDTTHINDFEKAERLVEFDVATAVEISNGNPLRWTLEERSPFNP